MIHLYKKFNQEQAATAQYGKTIMTLEFEVNGRIICAFIEAEKKGVTVPRMGERVFINDVLYDVVKVIRWYLKSGEHSVSVVLVKN